MKKFIVGFVFAGSLFIGCSPAFAAYPPVQDRGPVSVSTFTTISLQMIPQLLLSTGTNYSIGTSLPIGIIASSQSIPGQYMYDRISLDILNYSTHNIFMGYDKNVSTWAAPAPSYIGWMIPQASTMTAAGFTLPTPIPSVLHLPGSIRDIYVVADDTIPTRQILAVQQR